MLIRLRLKHLIAFVGVIILSHAWLPFTKVSRRRLPSLLSEKRLCCSFVNKFHTTAVMMISKQQLGSFEVIETSMPRTERRVSLLDYTNTIRDNNNATSFSSSSSSSSSSKFIDFDTAWKYQRRILDKQIERLKRHDDSNDANPAENSSFLPFTIDSDDQSSSCTKRCHDTVIMLQHNPVYTLGTGSDDRFILPPLCSSNETSNKFMNTTRDTIPVPVIKMDRGGEVTYHGPGQITVYPILDLRSYRQDIHWYMRALEEAIMLAISKCDNSNSNSNLQPERQANVTGVWVNDFKIAAVGICCRKWITMHGLAVNVEESSLKHFEGIIPCGLVGKKVGCVNQFIKNPITVHDFSVLMREALEEVFQIELVNQELMQ